MTQYLPCDILRDASGVDCSAGGISSQHDQVLLELEGDHRLPDISPEDPRPRVRLIKGRFGPDEYVHAVTTTNGNVFGGMFGGTFIHMSDSRFPHDYPVPLHDRFEGKLVTGGVR